MKVIKKEKFMIWIRLSQFRLRIRRNKRKDVSNYYLYHINNSLSYGKTLKSTMWKGLLKFIVNQIDLQIYNRITLYIESINKKEYPDHI